MINSYFKKLHNIVKMKSAAFMKLASHKKSGNDELVDELKAKGVISSLEVEQVMRAVDRRDFVTEDRSLYAYVDSPQPIGYNATISAPHMHALALVLAVSIIIGTIKSRIKARR